MHAASKRRHLCSSKLYDRPLTFQLIVWCINPSQGRAFGSIRMSMPEVGEVLGLLLWGAAPRQRGGCDGV